MVPMMIRDENLVDRQVMITGRKRPYEERVACVENLCGTIDKPSDVISF